MTPERGETGPDMRKMKVDKLGIDLLTHDPVVILKDSDGKRYLPILIGPFEATAIALALGTLCAIAIVRGRFPGREAIATFLVSPLMLPGLVIGIAMLQGFKAAGLRETYTSLLIAHVIITLPYIVRTVLGALSLFDFSLIDAARTLGCSYPAALMRVMVPALGPAFLTSGMFAFLASMDNYPISIFFTDAWTKTLPIQMLQYVEENPDPTIAAISAGLVLLAILALVVGDRLVGLRKLADF